MSVRQPGGVPQRQGWGEDPMTYWTKIFVRFLQHVFHSFEKGSYRWDDDPLNTDIVIQDQASIGREVVEKRPAIIVARGPMAFANLALDQFAGPTITKDGSGRFIPNEDPASGRRRYTDLVSATMTFNALSREGIEAQRIAWISAYAVRVMKRTLMHIGLHRVGEDISMGSESSPGSIVQPDSSEIVMVSVGVPFYFQETWTIEPVDKLLLKDIRLALSSEAVYPPIVAQPLRAPGFNGRVLQNPKLVSFDQTIDVGTLKTPKPR